MVSLLFMKISLDCFPFFEYLYLFWKPNLDHAKTLSLRVVFWEECYVYSTPRISCYSTYIRKIQGPPRIKLHCK